MKVLQLVTVAVLLATNSFAQNGELPNVGFENWTDTDLYDYPTLWKNSNQEEEDAPTVFKSADASDGTYSVELRALIDGQDTVGGYVFHGSVDQNGPDGGIPYSDAFDHIGLSFKSDLQAGDTVFAVVIRSTGGTAAPMEFYPITMTTATPNWTLANITISSGTQDSLFIGMILGSVTGDTEPTPGSWVRIDNVVLDMGGTATALLPDNSFENWSTETVENPDGWYTINEYLVSQGLENAIKTIDVNSGTYALEMTTIQLPGSGDTISSFLSTAPIDIFGSGSPFLNSPYNATPTTFSGAYKYNPANGDQAAFEIYFFAGGIEIGSHIEGFSSSPTWTTFSSPLTITGQPDSMSFAGFSGENPGSVLKLDDLSFSGGDVGINEFASMTVSVYPNPASSTIMIKAEGTYDYSIVDLAGNVVLSNASNNGVIELNISNLSNGAYLVKINNADNFETHKLIVE